MKRLLLVAGAAAFALGTPAHAKPGNGKHGKHGAHAMKAKGKADRGIITSGRHGRLYALNAGASCPPGLAKKGNGCMPPGQAKKMYRVGERYDRNSGNRWTYDQIPEYLQDQHRFDPDDRYYYNNGYLYQVDPKTMLIQQVISALLR